MGSLSTAVASFLEARSRQGQWLLRIDDLDTPRNTPGSVDSILSTLDTFGLHWDGPVDYQSLHVAEYEQTLAILGAKDLLYRCDCSRKNLSTADGRQPTVYPELCRNKKLPADCPHALRVKTDSRTVSFQDDLQGTVCHDLRHKDGDFILRRKDGIVAYQLAVVIDDARQRVNHVVRGIDLLEETPKQIYLQQLFELPTPKYMHVPIIVDESGYKLSKQTLATAVDNSSPHVTLYRLLRLLKQQPSLEFDGAPIKELIAWAIVHWQANALKNTRTMQTAFF